MNRENGIGRREKVNLMVLILCKQRVPQDGNWRPIGVWQRGSLREGAEEPLSVSKSEEWRSAKFQGGA
jgi:hypothetical protein